MLSQGTCTWFLFKEDTAKKSDDESNDNKKEQSSSSSSSSSSSLTDASNWERIETPFEKGAVTVPEALKKDDDVRAVCVQLSPLPLELDDLYNVAVAPCCGAVSSFIGTTRNTFQGRPVETLEYEIYGKMAEGTCASIAFRACQQWPHVRRVVMSHRSGEVGIGKPSVVIHVSSVHRKDGLEAVCFAIDTLKADVPIWKREFYRREREDDDREACSTWKANAECSGCRHGHRSAKGDEHHDEHKKE